MAAEVYTQEMDFENNSIGFEPRREDAVKNSELLDHNLRSEMPKCIPL
jgi:hypothetical protein